MIDIPDQDEFSNGIDAQHFRKWLSSLGFSLSGLARLMRELGDHRSNDAIQRSLQRMSTGNVRVSGEMTVILTLLSRQWAARCRRQETVSWAKRTDGSYEAHSDGFTAVLSPQTRGRWSISLVHLLGYSPPWPRWETSLEDAKARALLAIEEGIVDMDLMATERSLST